MHRVPVAASYQSRSDYDGPTGHPNRCHLLTQFTSGNEAAFGELATAMRAS